MTILKRILLSILAAGSIAANAGSFGAGIIIGNPTGLSFKTWLDRVHAIDMALAWDLGGEDSLSIHGDYLWHKFAVFEVDELPIDFYYGLGARLLFNDKDDNGRGNDDEDDVSIGPRAPAGLRYQFRDPKIEIFAEVALILEIVPDTDADIDLGIGARFFF